MAARHGNCGRRVPSHACVSIPSNLAEGRGRLGTGEFRRFVSIARGSTAEVETQLDVAVALAFADANETAPLLAKLDRLSKMLFGLYRSLDRADAAGGRRRLTAGCSVLSHRPSPPASRPSPTVPRGLPNCPPYTFALPGRVARRTAPLRPRRRRPLVRQNGIARLPAARG